MSRWYGNVVAVNDVSFTLGSGITGLLGPNGAGKTTILHMMAGLLRPSAGEVLDRRRPARPAIPRSTATLALVPEREAVHPFLTGYEFVRMSAQLQQLGDADDAARRAIELVDLGDAQHRKIETYSKGMRQRIKIAGALVHDPWYLLLDEPFNGMDPRQRLQMMEMLRSLAAAGRVDRHQLAHSRGARRPRDQRARDGRRPARRVGTLPRDPPADDRPSAHLHRPLERTTGAWPRRCSAIRRCSAWSCRRPASSFAPPTAARSREAWPRLARDADIRLLEIRPTDESLESVFSYLVDR